MGVKEDCKALSSLLGDWKDLLLTLDKWRTIGDFEQRSVMVDLGYNRVTLPPVLSRL